MTNEDYLDQLEILNEKLINARKDRDKFVSARMQEISPFQLGDIIQWNRKRGQVVGIARWVGDTPMWTVRLICKDGRLSMKNIAVRPYHHPIKEDKTEEVKQ